MALRDQDLDEFIDIYAADFGERLTREEIRPIAERLLSFVRLISKPSSGEGTPPLHSDHASS